MGDVASGKNFAPLSKVLNFLLYEQKTSLRQNTFIVGRRSYTVDCCVIKW